MSNSQSEEGKGEGGERVRRNSSNSLKDPLSQSSVYTKRKLSISQTN